jgi:RNA polymerase subunit RPABC4/transcription elongation factor Spt4
MTPLCTFCDIEMIDGQCPECFSIQLTELWRRQDMAEMLTRSRRIP